MNDFTKEGLQHILKAYNMDPYYVDQKVDKFGVRLQYLIDNYQQSEELKKITTEPTRLI